MKGIYALTVLVGTLCFLRTGYAENGNYSCAPAGRVITKCGRYLFDNSVNPDKYQKIETVVEHLSRIVQQKDVDGLIAHENAATKADDLKRFELDKRAFLFGQGPSATVPRRSVRQALLDDKVTSIYVEGHNVWETYRGQLYLIVFFDSTRLSLDQVAADLVGHRRYYMTYYVSTLIQLTHHG